MGRIRDMAREREMADLYAYGWTLQEIGDAYGLTRERVRQINKRNGLTRKSGGIHVEASRKQRSRNSAQRCRAEARCMFAYGCSVAERAELNLGFGLSDKRSPAFLFLRQKYNAAKRGIPWSLTFPQWMAIWQESGRWSERGRTGDAYVMARCGDTGGYAAGNVYITTLAGNVVDYQRELKRRGVVCADGFKRLPELARKKRIGPADKAAA